MNKLNTLPLGRNHASLGATVTNIGRKLGGWWRRRQNAKIVAELSPDQMRDCGIEIPQRNVPVIEVPRELVRLLPSPLVMD
jgi:uncharacterized protein YjiS (DUF1127 family)